MNKILILLWLLLPVAAYSQSVVPKIIAQTGGATNDAISLNISGKMLRMSFGSEDSKQKNDKELQEFLSNVKNISILMMFDLNPTDRTKIQKILSPFEELLSVTENDAKIAMYILEEKGQIVEFVMCVNTENNVTVMNITGKIDLAQLAKLSEGVNMDMNGTNYLKNLNQLKKTK